MVSNKQRIVCCEFCDIMLCVGSSISLSIVDVIIWMKYEIYKLGVITISVIHVDKGGIYICIYEYSKEIAA